MNNADIQYHKLLKVLQGIDKRLIKIEAAMVKEAPKKIQMPAKVNAERTD
jgi:hypothetical protein